MKKVKIATLWSSKNFGAFLQAYALHKFISDNGFCPQFIRETDEITIPLLKRCIHDIACQFGLMGKEKQYNYIQGRKFKKFYKKLQFCSICDDTFATVAGSDEIWNVANPYFPHLPMYVGEGCYSTRVISYAPSSNISTAEQFRNVYGEQPFSKLYAVSVRDKSTFDLVKSISPAIDVNIVLDPTFLVDNYNELIEENDLSDYMFVYGYSFSQDEQQQIIDIARKNNFKIVSAGPYLGWTDIQLPSSPGEFLGLVKGARMVVTSTFHGTVFSIIYNKHFASFARNSSKIIDLLDSVGLSDRNSTLSSASEVLSKTINYNQVNAMVSSKRAESRSFLQKALNK